MSLRCRRRLSTLQVALGVSVAVHAALLTVRFVDPEGFNRVFQDTPLEVILVNSRSGEAPEQGAGDRAGQPGRRRRGREGPRHLAAAALGADRDRRRATKTRSKQIEQLQETQQQLLAQIRRELALLPPPDPQREQGTPEEREQEERRRQLVEMLAEIEKRINEENARPKKRYISPATREEVYALYYDQLRRKIEERGTRNFPENQGKKLYGELTMNVTVDADGRVRRHRDRARLGLEGARPARGRDRRTRRRRSAASPRRCARRPTRSSITSRFRFTREEGSRPR